MAIAATSLEGAASATNATSYETGSITPTANRLILAAVGHSRAGSGANEVPTLTGNGLTWVEVGTVQSADASAGRRVTVFRAMGASPSAGVVTIDFAGATQGRCAWSIVEFSDVDTGGTNGSAAVVQFQTASATTGTAGTADFTAAFGDAVNNATYSAITTAGGTANPITEEAGFTELHDLQPGTEAQRLETMWRLGEDQTPAPTWTDSLHWAQLVVEIKAAGGGGTQSLTGTLFTNAPTFNVGTITGGAVALNGVLFAKASTFPTGVVTAIADVTVQYARPDADLDAAGWASAPLFSKLQTYPWNLTGAGNFIDSPQNPTGLDSETVKFTLSNVTDPGTNKGHRLRVVWYKNGTSTMRGDVELYQGATLIASFANTSTGVLVNGSRDMFDTYLLTELEAAAITDYTDLRIWVRPNRTAGATNTDLRLRAVELEVPGDALDRTLPAGVPNDPWMHLTADSLDLADGASVGAWQDDSGNGNSLYGRGGTQNPTFKAAISEFNNLSAVRFDGVDDRLAIALTEVVEDFTFAVHLIPRSLEDSRGPGNFTPCLFSTDRDTIEAGNKTLLAIIDDTITVEPCATLDIPDWMITQTGAAHVTGGTPVLGDEFVIVVRFKTGADEIWENGVRVAQCDANSESNRALQIGCREDNTRHIQMDLRRLLFYDRNLTDQEITDLTAGLFNESASVSQIPNATTSNDGWDTAPLAGQSIHTYIATDDSDYITVTVP